MNAKAHREDKQADGERQQEGNKPSHRAENANNISEVAARAALQANAPAHAAQKGQDQRAIAEQGPFKNNRINRR